MKGTNYLSNASVAITTPLSGVADAFDGSSFCLTTTRVVKEVVDVVIVYLRDHPEQRNHDASSLVTTALKEKFPCN